MADSESAAPFGGADPDDVSFVTGSVYRMAVLDALRDEPKIPSAIAEETGHGMAHISRALREMADRGLVECLVPDRQRNRYYDTTDDGEAFVDAAGHLLETEAR